MRSTFLRLAVLAGLALGAAGCMNHTRDATIADYCSDPRRANYDLCKQHRDIMQVDARAGQAQASADRAQATANQAMARNLNCKTSVVNRSRTGSCADPGFQLTSCVQTRYTRRAGGMAILRSINDDQCRFNSRVLEMQVRCCRIGTT
jgi:hypothetical protein